MDAPPSPPNPKNLDAWASYALQYLKEQLREDAPRSLGPGSVFPNSPLDGEGAVVIFPFESKHGAAADPNYYVAVGASQANYYPAYGLSVQEAYELHLGTRFMLVMGVAQRPPRPEDEFELEREARRVVERVAPDATLADLELAASFDVEGQLHAVIKCHVAGKPVYIMAADAPMGFSLKTDLPAPVAYRLHIGHALRHEPEPRDD